MSKLTPPLGQAERAAIRTIIANCRLRLMPEGADQGAWGIWLTPDEAECLLDERDNLAAKLEAAERQAERVHSLLVRLQDERREDQREIASLHRTNIELATGVIDLRAQLAAAEAERERPARRPSGSNRLISAPTNCGL